MICNQAVINSHSNINDIPSYSDSAFHSCKGEVTTLWVGRQALGEWGLGRGRRGRAAGARCSGSSARNIACRVAARHKAGMASKRKRTTIGHPHLPTSEPLSPHPIDAAIRSLVPSGSRRDILALFDNQITWGAIKHWRKGRHAPSAWAKERITIALTEQAKRYLHPLETLRATPDPIPYASNIPACRAAQMEKARG